MSWTAATCQACLEPSVGVDDAAPCQALGSAPFHGQHAEGQGMEQESYLEVELRAWRGGGYRQPAPSCGIREEEHWVYGGRSAADSPSVSSSIYAIRENLSERCQAQCGGGGESPGSCHQRGPVRQTLPWEQSGHTAGGDRSLGDEGPGLGTEGVLGTDMPVS